MSRTIEVRAVRYRKKICLTLVEERLATTVYGDQAKAALIAFVTQSAREGLAQWTTLGNGIIELTLFSGEVFHLGETSVTRVG
jgi:hypothetical protein